MLTRWKRCRRLLWASVGGTVAFVLLWLAVSSSTPPSSVAHAWSGDSPLAFAPPGTFTYTQSGPITVTFQLTSTRDAVVTLIAAVRSLVFTPTIALPGQTPDTIIAYPFGVGESHPVGVSFAIDEEDVGAAFQVVLTASVNITDPQSVTVQAEVVWKSPTPAPPTHTPTPTTAPTETPAPTDTPTSTPTDTPPPEPQTQAATIGPTPMPPETVGTTEPPVTETASPSPEPSPLPEEPSAKDNDWVFLVVGLVGLFGLLGLVLFAWRWLRPQKKRPPTAEQPIERPSGPRLHCQSMVDGPREFSLTQAETTIGRGDDAGLRIDENFYHWETVSRQHARILLQGRRVVVQDLDSTNGIYVNGRRTRRNLLKDGWELKIGGVAFIFRAGAENSKRSTR